MEIRDGFIGSIGNTPLIKLRRASEETGCTILGKAEFLNPGGSVKDRPARHMILEAEKRGELRAGGVVVESTAGNTGIGLALVANARGYRTVIVIPETQSEEKKDMLRLCGAELIEVEHEFLVGGRESPLHPARGVQHEIGSGKHGWNQRLGAFVGRLRIRNF